MGKPDLDRDQGRSTAPARNAAKETVMRNIPMITAAFLELVIAGLVAAALAGCASSSTRTSELQADMDALSVPTPPLAVADAKKAILATRNRLWKDPYSIRDASIGGVHPCILDDLNGVRTVRRAGQCVCVALNAKNSMGGYTGLRRTLFVFWNDARDIDTRDGAVLGYDEYCRAMQPFPEMNARSG